MKQSQSKRGKKKTVKRGAVPLLAAPRFQTALGLAVLLFLMGFVTTIIANSSDPVLDDEILTVERIPLKDRDLVEWCCAARMLAVYRDQHKIGLPVETLPELIEWGRNHPAILQEIMQDTDPLTFLGLAFSIKHARRNIRMIIEHEIRAEEAMTAKAGLGDCASWTQPDGPPMLKGWEQRDLAIYQENEQLLEEILLKLLPELPPLVPEFDVPLANADWETDGYGEEALKAETESKPVSWRIISQSRYGPRILRKKK